MANTNPGQMRRCDEPSCSLSIVGRRSSDQVRCDLGVSVEEENASVNIYHSWLEFQTSILRLCDVSI